MRLFVATDLPPALLERITRLQTQLDPGDAYARWVRPESLHLTLRFLGEVEPDRLQSIERSLRVVDRAAFNVVVSGVGFFPSERSPRVFWLGMQSDGLRQLAQEIEHHMVEAGFSPEKRGFTPHLTLARAPKKGRLAEQLVANARALTRKTFGSFILDRFHLYQSQLHPSGAVYTRLHSYTLTGLNDAGSVIQ